MKSPAPPKAQPVAVTTLDNDTTVRLYLRINEWMKTTKPAHLAFTSGIERTVATLIEEDRASRSASQREMARKAIIAFCDHFKIPWHGWKPEVADFLQSVNLGDEDGESA